MENEDQASALLRFQNGVYGMTEMSRIAFGSKMAPTNVVTGTQESGDRICSRFHQRLAGTESRRRDCDFGTEKKMDSGVIFS